MWVEGGAGIAQEGRFQHIPAGPVVLEAPLVHVHLRSWRLEVQGHYRQDTHSGCSSGVQHHPNSPITLTGLAHRPRLQLLAWNSKNEGTDKNFMDL